MISVRAGLKYCWNGRPQHMRVDAEFADICRTHLCVQIRINSIFHSVIYFELQSIRKSYTETYSDINRTPKVKIHLRTPKGGGVSNTRIIRKNQNSYINAQMCRLFLQRRYINIKGQVLVSIRNDNPLQQQLMKLHEQRPTRKISRISTTYLGYMLPVLP